MAVATGVEPVPPDRQSGILPLDSATTFTIGCEGTIRTCMNRVRAGYPTQLDDLALLRREPADTVCFLDKRSNRSLHHSSKISSVNSLLSQTGCRGAIRTPVSGFKVQSPAARRPASRFQCDCSHAPDAQHRRLIDVVAKSSALRTRMIHQVAVVSSAVAVELRCKLDFKAFEFNRLCTHNLVAARRIELPSQP